MPKVYAPQVPSKYDGATKLWVPSINVDHAKNFGEVVVMLPPNANRLHIAPLVAELLALKGSYKQLTGEDFGAPPKEDNKEAKVTQISKPAAKKEGGKQASGSRARPLTLI